MLQPAESNSPKSSSPNSNSYSPSKAHSVPMEQATIGRSLVIKGEISGAESVFIDGKVEGTIHLTDNRVSIGRNGVITANINAREVVIMGNVTGNVECSDRLDIRAEGSLTGDVITQRISVEDGAVLTGSVEVRATDTRNVKPQTETQMKPTTALAGGEAPKAAAASAGS